MYDTFLRDVETYFEEVRLLKRGARGSVTLLRHRSTGKRYIFRRFTGSAEVYRKLYDLAHTDPDWMHGAPHNAQIGRPDEVRAARNPVLRYEKP